MPDWKKELRAVIDDLGLDACREQSIMEEFAEHLADQYDDLISSGKTNEEHPELCSKVGIYGVVSYVVVQRTRELGIRLALGAAGSHILRMILSDGSRLLAAGMAVGLVMVFATGRVLEQLLFGLKTADPSTLALSIAGLCIFALSAALIPARSAARLNPIETLRQE